VRFRRCPSAAALERLLDGCAPEASKRRLSDHVRDCPFCRAVFEVMKEIAERDEGILDELGGPDVAGPEARARLRTLARRELRALRGARRPAFGSLPRRLALPSALAVLVLAAAFAVLPVLRSSRTPAMERNAGESAIALVSPRGGVAGEPIAFSWTAAPGVHAYRLEIYDRALEPVYASPPLSGAHFTLPAGAAGPLLLRTPYFWKIVAASAEGKRIESEFGKFLIHR
jgi:hypothetical protein